VEGVVYDDDEVIFEYYSELEERATNRQVQSNTKPALKQYDGRDITPKSPTVTGWLSGILDNDEDTRPDGSVG